MILNINLYPTNYYPDILCCIIPETSDIPALGTFNSTVIIDGMSWPEYIKILSENKPPKIIQIGMPAEQTLVSKIKINGRGMYLYEIVKGKVQTMHDIVIMKIKPIKIDKGFYMQVTPGKQYVFKIDIPVN